MKIWVDADACPVVVKEILYKAAERTRTRVILVANRPLRIPKSSHIACIRVASGLDVADTTIARDVEPGDMVVTSDIPLAALIVAKGAVGINPRGEIYSPENIHERLSARNFMESLRSSGIETGGPAAMSSRDKQAFANALDQFLAKKSTTG